MAYKILIRRERLMSSPALRLTASNASAKPNTASGTFRLDGNPIRYAFVHPFKSRFLVVQVDEIPQELLTSLSIYNIDFRIETPEQAPQPVNVTPEQAPQPVNVTPELDLVTLCNTNTDLANSNIALRLELEALNTKYLALCEQLLALAKTLESP